MRDVLFDLTWQSSQKSKLVPVARLLFVSPIITSRELLGTHLATNEALLCTCRKRTLPCQHVTEASTYITVHYRNDIHVLSRCMDSVQPRTPSVWMECILALHVRHAECTRIKHVATTQLMSRRDDGIRGMDHSINPRNSRDAAQHTYQTRGSSSLVVQEIKSVIK
jgi:hypothetical protein